MIKLTSLSSTERKRVETVIGQLIDDAKARPLSLSKPRSAEITADEALAYANRQIALSALQGELLSQFNTLADEG